jgi:hypothetical protein
MYEKSAPDQFVLETPLVFFFWSDGKIGPIFTAEFINIFSVKIAAEIGLFQRYEKFSRVWQLAKVFHKVERAFCAGVRLN